ncbi:hypothetical protein J4Q44_G00191070 [Coregonus suidteri]|uniref:Uncharacterized protein n=1 Tax=Coregonus suidteri TaxID=861788 RepID=A0AAN8LMA8_9TELE
MEPAQQREMNLRTDGIQSLKIMWSQYRPGTDPNDLSAHSWTVLLLAVSALLHHLCAGDTSFQYQQVWGQEAAWGKKMHWKHVTMGDMLSYISLVIYMGLVKAAPVLGCHPPHRRCLCHHPGPAPGQLLSDKGPSCFLRDPSCGTRAGMEKSFERFEEELDRQEPPPQKPVRRPGPEMYAQERRRTLQERTMPSQQESPVMQQVPKMMPRERSLPARSMPLRKAMSLQNLSQIETPWEGVTLNRCLFIAITILLLSTGFQKLQETIKGGRGVEEEEYDIALTVRRSSLRHKVQPQEVVAQTHKILSRLSGLRNLIPNMPETSLYEVLFWWFPDFDDGDNEEDDEGETKQDEQDL